MKKNELIRSVASSTGFTKRDVETVIDTLFDTISTTMCTEDVSIVGFGKFSSKKTKDRAGINPVTMEPLTIHGRKVPKFSASSILKKAVLESCLE